MTVGRSDYDHHGLMTTIYTVYPGYLMLQFNSNAKILFVYQKKKKEAGNATLCHKNV